MVIKDGWKDTVNKSANAQDNPSIRNSWGHSNTRNTPIAKTTLHYTKAIA